MRTIKQLMLMDNRTTLITGATGGLGQHMAETIAELGGGLILVDKPGSDYLLLMEILKKLSLFPKKLLLQTLLRLQK